MAAKGKWAQGIAPRDFGWFIKGKLAICERPGGYGASHRRVRRQEEIIWIREQGFTSVISLIPTPHNLHNYDELGVNWLHRPLGLLTEPEEFMCQFYPELRSLLAGGGKYLMHGEEISDRMSGMLGGYLRWAGLVPQPPQVISLVERIMGKQMDSIGRGWVEAAGNIPQLSSMRTQAAAS